MNLQTATDIISLLLGDNKNYNVIKALKVIDEVNHAQKKYCWHDLRKNPNDLPEERGIYIVVSGYMKIEDTRLRFFDGKKFGYDLREKNEWLWNPIAWMMFPKFEEE